MIVKEGTKWGSADGKVFRVINVVDANDNTWVHYREERGFFNRVESKEFSCYQESFVQRFRQLPELLGPSLFCEEVNW